MRRALLTMAFCWCLSASNIYGQDQDRAPWLNAFGRFWGIGYSPGYHARTESRLGLHRVVPTHNVVPEPVRGMHANPYMSGNAGPYAGYGMGASYANPYGPGMNAPSSAPALPGNTGAAVPASKPVEPPPNWLKQYIKPDGESKANTDDLLPGNDDSPSDRKGVMLAPSPADSTTSLSITPAQPPIQIGGRPVISVLQQ